MLGGCPYEWQRVPGLQPTRCFWLEPAARPSGGALERSIFVLMKWGARRPRGERIAPYDCRAIPGPDGTRTFKAYGARAVSYTHLTLPTILLV